MNRHAIYMSNGQEPDMAIQRGLVAAGCEIHNTREVSETLRHLVSMNAASDLETEQKPSTPVLVAEVQAGAIALLKMIRDSGQALPTTLIFDREGDVPAAVLALRFGVSGYMLASDPEMDREVETWVIAGLANAPNRPSTQNHASNANEHVTSKTEFKWVPREQMVVSGKHYVRLSPIEAIIFDLLYTHRGHVVHSTELIERTGYGQRPPDVALVILRPHMMRLRQKLGSCASWLSVHIQNVRGKGYMLL
jgi:DNA-binding response OmpR family regulator